MSTADSRPHLDPENSSIPKTKYSNESFGLAGLLIVVGIFASTMPQPQVLGKLPLQNILKNSLHVTKPEMAAFFFWCGLFWYLKPLAGILTDAFPLFRTRRRHYLLISSLLAGLSWIAMGIVPLTYKSLLYTSIVVNLFMVMMSTVVGAVLVEVGQSRGATGRLTGIRQITSNFCTLITGPLAGFLASGAFAVAAGANAILVISIFPVAYMLLKEKPGAMRNADAFKNAGRQMATIGRSYGFWMSLFFIALFYFAPGFSTLLYYRQNDVLKLSQQQIGYLGSLGGLGGIIAAFAYVFLAKRVRLLWLLVFGIVTAAAGTFFYLVYNSYVSAFAIDFQNGLFFGFAEVALIDLAARGTPAGCEGLGYSLIMSVRNLSLFGADYVGSKMAESYKIPWNTMVIVNGVTTAVVLILLPFMPSFIMSSRDGTRPNTENTGEPEPEAA